MPPHWMRRLQKAEGDIVAFLLANGECSTHCNWQSPAYDAVSTEIASRDIGNVHGATTPATITLLLTEEFSEHQFRISAFADAVAVAAVGGGNVVRPAQCHGCSDGAGLLPNREVHGTVDEASHIGFLRSLFKTADQMHSMECSQ